jgi:Transglutaminase-like superfamily
MAQWRKFWNLPAQEWRGILWAMVQLPLLNVGLWGLGLRRLQRTLVWWMPTGGLEQGEPAHQQAVALARLVTLAARYGPYRATCLRQALLVWWWVRRAGIAGELRIGVQRTASQFTAHAWVEVGGVAVNDRADVGERFRSFDSYRFDGITFQSQ